MLNSSHFTLLNESGLGDYSLTQIWFESDGFYYYYRCKFGGCSLEKFANNSDLDNLENELARVELDTQLSNKDGFCDVYPQAHYIVIGKLLAELPK
jgi:hypothetical protein